MGKFLKRFRGEKWEICGICEWNSLPLVMHIDHINGNRNDNRFDNLRLATDSQNIRNQKKRKTNTSGFKGVGWSKQNKKWRSRLV